LLWGWSFDFTYISAADYVLFWPFFHGRKISAKKGDIQCQMAESHCAAWAPTSDFSLGSGICGRIPCQDILGLQPACACCAHCFSVYHRLRHHFHYSLDVLVCKKNSRTGIILRSYDKVLLQ
jgi:hypothetical protein